MKNLILVLLLALLASCGNTSRSTNKEVSSSDDHKNPVSAIIPNSDWLIPVADVLDGGIGKDGIPSVDNAKFDAVKDIDFLNDESLVIGLIHHGKAKAYPHPILDWHEIINDGISDINYALTYCPLTGTGIAWDREVDGSLTTFGVSGKVFNTNLMPYDRKTNSYWSQLRLDCVHGDLVGGQIETFPIIETSWATWKKAYPKSLVMNTNTGVNRDYEAYPYGNYRTSHSNIIFPVNPLDKRLPAKERVLGVFGESNKRIYSLELFDNGRIIEDKLGNKDLLIIGSKRDNYIVAFEKRNQSKLRFLSGQLPIIAVDQEGNKITLSGAIVAGPLAGVNLVSVNSFMGYFFAFGAFHIDIDIYQD